MYHTLQAGRVDEAREIYYLRLGTYQHLAWNLGQYSRCIRVLKECPRCPDAGGLVWCYRALGDLEATEAAVDPDDHWWLSMVACLRGRLRDVTKMLASNRQDPLRAVAEFLTGNTTLDTIERAPIWPGLPVTGADCYLAACQLPETERLVARTLEELKHAARGATWSDEVARFDLIKAEIERRRGNLRGARGLLEKATQWIVQSGSQEHLCALHLGKARLAIDEQDYQLGKTALEEGLHVAEQCGFGFYSIHLQIALARLLICTEDFAAALYAAMAARNGILRQTHKPPETSDVELEQLLVIGADHPNSQYAWAVSLAGSLQGYVLAKLGKLAEAKQILVAILELQKRIGDPHLEKTRTLIASLT